MISPDLLWQLKILLLQLTQILTMQTAPAEPSQAPPAVVVPAAPAPLSRTHLDNGIPLTVITPEILSISPTHGGIGTTITIRGRGFTKTGNDVYASFGTFTDLLSADGETITLRVLPPGLPVNLGTVKTASFPILRYRFYIRNANGETRIPGEFMLDLWCWKPKNSI